jgi:hypothetical protein
LAETQKTLPHGSEADVTAFLDRVPAKERREDGFKLLDIMRRITHAKPVIWGTAIVGFGTHTYKYADGREGIAPKIGFSPRSSRLVVYLPLWQKDLRQRLTDIGPHEATVSCLYLKRLSDVDLHAFEELIAAAYKADAPFPGRKRLSKSGVKKTAQKASTKKVGKKKAGKKAGKAAR